MSGKLRRQPHTAQYFSLQNIFARGGFCDGKACVKIRITMILEY